MSSVATEIPATAFELRESIAVGGGAVRDDGTVLLHLIRPCVGRGKGNHLYEAPMLERNAGVFKGWKMYIDHLSPEAKRRAGGLPRSVRDLGGRIVESYWDPNVPADPTRGFGQGAVVGLTKPVPLVRELIATDPELVEASINAQATGIQAGTRGGQRVWIVEGIAPRPGTVDWVTEAGAGGRVVEVMEATLQESLDTEREQLNAMTNEELVEWLQAERPDLYEAVQKGQAVDDAAGAAGAEDEDAELEQLVQKYIKQGLNRKMAIAAAKRKLASSSEETQEARKGDYVPLTANDLREALATDEGKAVLREVLAGSVSDLTEAAFSERLERERDEISLVAQAHADRQIQLRDFRELAHVLIAEAKRLPEKFKEQLRAEYELGESGPTPKLDVIDEIDGEGAVTKTAEEKLREAIADDLKLARELVASANPSRVSGQGPGAVVEGDASGETEKPKTGSANTDSFLVEAGFSKDELDGMYTGIFG